MYGVYEQRRAIWLLAACPNVPCGRGVMIRVPTRSSWALLDTGDDGLLLASTCVLPLALSKAFASC